MASGKNINYNRSANVERAIKKRFESDGWAATRAAGSHGIDVVAWRRAIEPCGHPNHYNVTQTSVKVSVNIKENKIGVETVELPYGTETIQRLTYAVKGRKK